MFCRIPGAHHWETATTPYSCHGVFTDRSIFSLNLSRIQIRIVLSLPKRAHVDWNWLISREKYLKIDWSVKMLLHWLIMGRAGS